jgi:hypothetical protein
MERASIIASLVLASLAAIGFGAVATSSVSLPAFETSIAREERHERLFPQQLAEVNAAIARKDVSRAILEWRDAYGLALGSRRWETMVEVGDAAARIDALAGLPSGHPTGFRAEARQAYLRALFQARSVRSPAGIERVAAAFAALGDKEMAARARAVVVTP